MVITITATAVVGEDRKKEQLEMPLAVASIKRAYR